MAQNEKPKDDPFTFDYHQLRVGGLIMAAVLCLIGITILLSGHCRCKFRQNKRYEAKDVNIAGNRDLALQKSRTSLILNNVAVGIGLGFIVIAIIFAIIINFV